MKLKTNIYVLFIIALCITSACKKTSKEIETDCLTSAIKNLNLTNNTKWIVILPGLGCHGCIQEAEIFMRDYVKHNDIAFVLTSISSLKILQQKIGVQVKDHANIYVDKNNEFKIPTDNNIYPCIIKVENGKIVAHEFQSPKNGEAFRNLKNSILTQ